MNGRQTPPPWEVLGRVPDSRYAAGLRLLLFLGTEDVRNLAGPTGTVAVSGGSVAYGPNGGWREFTRVNGTTGDYVSLGALSGYLPLARSFTVMARVRTRTSPNTIDGDINNSCCAVGADQTGARGWLLEVDTYNGGANATNGATFWYVNASGSAFSPSENAAFQENTDYHLCGVVDVEGAGVSLYRDGVLKQTEALTGSPATADPTLYVGRRGGVGGSTADHFDGHIGWVALFDRALSADEVALWAAEDWEALFPADTAAFSPALVALQVEFETTSQAGQSASLNFPMVFETTTGAQPWEAIGGDLEFTTAVDLLAAVGGSLESAPPAGDFAFETVVGVLTPIVLSPPVLVHYATVTDAGEALSFGVPMEFETVTGARARLRTTLDGRRDLLDTRRYRR